MPVVSHFEDIGGEPALRKIIDTFVDRIFDDMMIGFHFRKADRARVKRFEYEHAAQHLGADVRYTGRPLRAAHAAHHIMGGQFMRRRQILVETLDEFGVPPEIRDAWLATQDALRGEITAQPGSACD